MNIIFVGLPASGKSYFAEKMSNLIHCVHLDTDNELKRIFNSNNDSDLSIPEIYRKIGNQMFRELEGDVLRQLDNAQNKIVSTGGGIIESEKSIEILKKSGYIIYLKVPLDVLENRITRMKPREIFKNGIKEILYQLNEKRNRIYEEISNTIVMTKHRTEEEILIELLNIYQKQVNKNYLE